MDYIKLSHCVYYCDYHVVIVTKYRYKVFNEGIFSYFKEKFKELGKHYPLIKIKEINHDVDHIHILISIPPVMGVGSAIRIIKSNTTVGLKEKFPFLRKLYSGNVGVWSDGYFVSTVGLNESIIKKYIKKQGEEDSGQTKFGLD